MKTAHFYDLDVLFNIDRKPWIININNPLKPIYRLPLGEWELAKSGIFKSNEDSLLINFAGEKLWLSPTISEKLSKMINPELLGIVYSEWKHPEVISKLNIKFNQKNWETLQRVKTPFYLITLGLERTNKLLTNELIDYLPEKPKKLYYVSSYNPLQWSGDEMWDKSKIALSHINGHNLDTKEIYERYDSVKLFQTFEYSLPITKVADEYDVEVSKVENYMITSNKANRIVKLKTI